MQFATRTGHYPKQQYSTVRHKMGKKGMLKHEKCARPAPSLPQSLTASSPPRAVARRRCVSLTAAAAVRRVAAIMAVFHGDNKDKQMMFNVKDLEKICSKEKGVTQLVRGARSSCRARTGARPADPLSRRRRADGRAGAIAERGGI